MLTTNRSLTVLAALSAITLALLSACGDETGDNASGKVERTHNITSEAIAAVALEHVEDEPRRATAESEPGEGVAASMNFGSDDFDNQFLAVGVGEEALFGDCADDSNDGCEEVEIDGKTVWVAWQEEEPEEDPGVVSVWTERDDVLVTALYAGDVISGDPRDQDLFIDVGQLIDIVSDDRLADKTSEDVIEMGEDLDVTWEDE